jgi:selenocysteine-specific elongation factor
MGDDAPREFRHRARYKLHIGTAEVEATLSILDPKEFQTGRGAQSQFFLAEPIVAVHGQPFVVREESPPSTLGGGRVVEPTARRVRRRDGDARSRLEQRGSADPVERLAGTLEGFGLDEPSERALCRETGLSSAELSIATAQLESRGAFVSLVVGRRTVTLPSAVLARLEEHVIRTLGRLHKSRPRHSAVPRSHLAANLRSLVNDSLVSAIIDRLAHQGRVEVDMRSIALVDHSPKLSQGERKLSCELHEAIRSGGFSPPDMAALGTIAGARVAVVPELLALLRDEERIVEITPQLFLDFDWGVELRRRVVEKLGMDGTMTMSDLRDLLGTSRKYAVPIGEYLDRIGLTERDGDSRRLGRGARELEQAAP